MVVQLSAEDIRSVANWPLVISAIRDGHELPKAVVGDTFVGGGGNTMLVRSAWIEGLSAGVKAATVVPENPNRPKPLPAIHAQVMLFSHETGQLTALLDGTEVTAWKTAGDSALGCDFLARPDAETLVMVGAGAMAQPLIEAHLSVRPGIRRVLVWNRTSARVEALAKELSNLPQTIEIADNLPDAVAQADIVCCATMTSEPVLKGEWVPSGCHVDLVGAYKADMREADDELHRKGTWFVDSLDTTFGHIGELQIPFDAGLITRDSVKGDFHALVSGSAGRSNDDEITVFKNGGGAHLDVMVCNALATEFGKAQ